MKNYFKQKIFFDILVKIIRTNSNNIHFKQVETNIILSPTWLGSWGKGQCLDLEDISLREGFFTCSITGFN